MENKKKYIALKEYKDAADDEIFGYQALDYDTKEIKYFSFYTKEDVYTPNILHEFDPSIQDPDYFINDHFIFGGFIRTNTSILPDELVKSVKDNITLNQKYNEANNRDSKNLLDNSSYLAINYIGDYTTLLHGCIEDFTTASYESITNQIGFFVDSLNWKYLDENIKRIILNASLHEVGHMEATSKVLDSNNNTLYIYTGFSHNAIRLKPIATEDGVLYNTIDEIFNKFKYNEKALEEVANEYRCLLMTKNSYECVYPKLGEKLNTLLNNKLLDFRYNASIEDVITYLRVIDSSEDMAIELLDSIEDSLHDTNNIDKSNKVLTLIEKYQAKL